MEAAIIIYFNSMNLIGIGPTPGVYCAYAADMPWLRLAFFFFMLLTNEGLN